MILEGLEHGEINENDKNRYFSMGTWKLISTIFEHEPITFAHVNILTRILYVRLRVEYVLSIFGT